MSQPLARVTGDLEHPRGLDVVFAISVERGWFGCTIGIELPRNLNCARCEGGGCDDCDRGGAVSLRERGEEAEALRVVLPSLPEAGQNLRLRIPCEGGHAPDEQLGRGHLLLTVKPAYESSSGVSLLENEGVARQVDRGDLMKQSVFMAIVLILLFLGMLRLSGWL